MSAALQLAPDTSDLRTEGSALVQRATAIIITDDETFKLACDFLADVAARRKTIVEKFADPKRKAHDAHKSVCALEAELLEIVSRAENEAKRRISAYRTAQERITEDNRRAAEADARKLEEDRKLQEAIAAEADGDKETATAILDEPIAPPPVKVAPPTPKVSSVSFRETWPFEVTSLLDLVKHVAAHPEDINLLQANTSAIRSLVNARKSAFSIPGIRAWSDKNVAATGRK